MQKRQGSATNTNNTAVTVPEQDLQHHKEVYQASLRTLVITGLLLAISHERQCDAVHFLLSCIQAGIGA